MRYFASLLLLVAACHSRHTAVAGDPITLTGAGAIAGVVTDRSSGHTLSGVTVTLEYATTGGALRATSNRAGQFAFENVMPGRYELHTAQLGYRELGTSIVVTTGEWSNSYLALIRDQSGVQPCPPTSQTTPRRGRTEPLCTQRAP